MDETDVLDSSRRARGKYRGRGRDAGDIMFVTSSQALDALQHLAPRAWCKRLLLWRIFEGTTAAYFFGGSIVERRRPAGFLVDAQAENRDMSIALVEEQFGSEIADALRAVGCPEKIEKISEVFSLKGIETRREEWRDEPRIVEIGAFVFADEVNFESGILRMEEFSSGDANDVLFGEEHDFRSEYDDGELDVELRGLSFELHTIEMLAPNAPPLVPMSTKELHAPRPSHRGGPGRSRKWDWEGALARVVSIANTPDGLPEGHGAQAAIERMISEWFTATTSGQPPESEIRKRAAQVMRAISEGRK